MSNTAEVSQVTWGCRVKLEPSGFKIWNSTLYDCISNKEVITDLGKSNFGGVVEAESEFEEE